jgi:trimeric autotransporter adhesin
MKTVCSICLAAFFGLSTAASVPQAALAASPGGSAIGAGTPSPTPDFTISMTPAMQNVAAGGGATFTVTVASLNGNFAEPVVLEARGLPPGATATFSTASVTPGQRSATTTLTVQTVAQDAAILPVAPGGPSAAPLLGLLLVLPFGVRRRTRFPISCWTVIIAAAGMLQGCESGGALPLTETIASQATYTVTVTGTSGSIQHSVMMEMLLQTGSGLNT